MPQAIFSALATAGALSLLLALCAPLAPALAPRATVGSTWAHPAPVRSARRAGLLAALLAALGLAACGGGSDTSTAPDRICNPDTFDCVAMYGAEYPYAFEHVDASVQVFSHDATPRAGFVRIK